MSKKTKCFKEARAAINTLELTKRKLLQEIEDAEESLRCNTNRIPDHAISPSLFTGFELTDFSMTINGNEKFYIAFCYELRLFLTVTLRVLQQEDVVLNISPVIFVDSPLHEIHSTLLRFCEELCPYRVLVVIQQFTQMINFRSKIFHQLNTDYFFSTFRENNENEFQVPDTILHVWVYKTVPVRKFNLVLELQWHISWNKLYQSLVHQFSINKAFTALPEVSTFVNGLRNNDFHVYKEETLMQLWCNFNEWVSSPDPKVLLPKSGQDQHNV